MAFTFSYRNSGEDCDVTMEVSERPIEDMCEFFQRFLAASGYVIGSDEHITLTKITPS